MNDSTPTTGHDDHGHVSVTLDDDDRVTSVRVVADDPRIRRPDGLREAIDQATRAARLARLDARLPAGARAAGRPRPEAVRAQHQPVVGIENWMGTGWRPDPADLRPHHYDTDDLGPITGVSDNDCVSVTLGIASSSAVVTADPGWLANARVTLLENALDQAFEAAYRNREERR